MGDHRSRTVVRLVAESRFRGTSARQPHSVRAQEYILNEAGRIDARVALLEVTVFAFVFFVARHMVPIFV